MISEKIRQYRHQKGMSQEEVAVRLHVVRQTVSKWEKGLSVPDADMVMQLAALLEVPVTALLGMDEEAQAEANLAAELARLNEELAAKKQREKLLRRASEKRGMILFLSFVSMLAAVRTGNPVVSIILSGGCMLGAVVVLYRNLALLTSVTTDDLRLKTLRLATVFNITVVALCMVGVALMAAGVISLSEQQEMLLSIVLVAAAMIFTGWIAPKLPFTRHTGLRLPWTVRDEDTWNLAHRILGVISLPVAMAYIACALTMPDLKAVTVTAVFLWIGIPGVLSFVFFWKKLRGRL